MERKGLEKEGNEGEVVEKEVLGLEQIQFKGVDAGNGSSPEVEGAVLKEGITFRVFLQLCISCLLSHFASAVVLALVGGCI